MYPYSKFIAEMLQVMHNYLRSSFKPESKDLINEAIMQQWLRIDYSNSNRNIDSYSKFLNDIQSTLNPLLDYDSWSALFISYVMKCSGYMDFKFSDKHAHYIHESIIKRYSRLTSPFWGFRLNEHAPDLGDIICRNKKNSQITFDLASAESDFASSCRCDIVVHVGSSSLKTIGGDLFDSVSMSSYPITTDGYLKADGVVFAVLRNNC
jgi:hypothetical protein